MTLDSAAHICRDFVAAIITHSSQLTPGVRKPEDKKRRVSQEVPGTFELDGLLH